MAIAVIREDEEGTFVLRVFEGEEGEALQEALKFAEDYIRENGDKDEIELAELLDILKHMYIERRNGLTYVQPVEITDGVFLSVIPAKIELVGGYSPQTFRDTANKHIMELMEKIRKIKIDEDDIGEVKEQLEDEWIPFEYVWQDEHGTNNPARFTIGKDGKVWVEPEYGDAFPFEEFYNLYKEEYIYTCELDFWDALIELDNFFKGLLEGE